LWKNAVRYLSQLWRLVCSISPDGDHRFKPQAGGKFMAKKRDPKTKPKAGFSRRDFLTRAQGWR